MVGNEEGIRYQCRNYEGIYCPSPECQFECQEGISVLKRRHSALEVEPLADDVNAEDQATAKATTATGFHDAGTGSSVPLESAGYAASSPIFPDRLVHGQPPQRDNGPEVVDGES